VHLPFYEVAARAGRSRLRVSVNACSGEARAADRPEERPARKTGSGAGAPLAATALMLLAGALLPTWWLAAAAILPLAMLLYWALAAADQR
jgi:hypothetical protein